LSEEKEGKKERKKRESAVFIITRFMSQSMDDELSAILTFGGDLTRGLSGDVLVCALRARKTSRLPCHVLISPCKTKNPITHETLDCNNIHEIYDGRSLSFFDLNLLHI
jgi:hypothetical protein